MKLTFRKRNTGTDLINENGEIINPNQIVKIHGEKVFSTIQTVISALDDLAAIFADLNKMGYDHYKYGARVEHFQVYFIHFI